VDTGRGGDTGWRTFFTNTDTNTKAHACVPPPTLQTQLQYVQLSRTRTRRHCTRSVLHRPAGPDSLPTVGEDTSSM
jgi:hypothetical protein